VVPHAAKADHAVKAAEDLADNAAVAAVDGLPTAQNDHVGPCSRTIQHHSCNALEAVPGLSPRMGQQYRSPGQSAASPWVMVIRNDAALQPFGAMVRALQLTKTARLARSTK